MRSALVNAEGGGSQDAQIASLRIEVPVDPRGSCVAGSALSSASDSAESLFVCALAFSGRDVRFRWWLPRHEVREPIFQHVFAAGWDSLPRHRGPQVQDDRLLDSR